MWSLKFHREPVGKHTRPPNTYRLEEARLDQVDRRLGEWILEVPKRALPAQASSGVLPTRVALNLSYSSKLNSTELSVLF
jgi:hypothetical protein